MWIILTILGLAILGPAAILLFVAMATERDRKGIRCRLMLIRETMLTKWLKWTGRLLFPLGIFLIGTAYLANIGVYAILTGCAMWIASLLLAIAAYQKP
jgi:hypothetical protein